MTKRQIITTQALDDATDARGNFTPDESAMTGKDFIEAHVKDLKSIIMAITPKGNLSKTKSKRPEDGVNAYIWRMIRFHCGTDMRFPITCFYYLADEIEKATGEKFSCGILGPKEKEILNILDETVRKISAMLGWDDSTMARRMQGVLY